MRSQYGNVDVRVADGRWRQESRTLWSSEHGPIVTVPPPGWSDTTAYALRDVNEDAGRTFHGYIEMGQAGSVRQLDAVTEAWQLLPWIQPVAADSTGEAYYGYQSVLQDTIRETPDRRRVGEG